MTNMKKEILAIIADFINLHPTTIKNYLPFIKDSVLMIFKKDMNPLIKEESLKVLNQIIRIYSREILDSTINCHDLTQLLLNEIKFLRPTASVAGRIWSLLGNLSEKFEEKMKTFQVEIQEVMFDTLKTQMADLDKPQIKTIVGCLQGFNSCLGYNKLKDPSLQELFIL